MAARVFFLFALGYFLSYFYRSANAVLAKDLSQELGLGPAELGFMTSLFYLAFAAAQLPLGGLLDRVGPRAVTPALLLVAALVLSLELVNTALEALTDLVSPVYHPLAKRAKDTAAAAVFLASLFALGLGVYLFLPALWARLGLS